MKILFTGTGERMIENVIAMIPDNHEMLRCMPTETDFILALRKNKPDTVIICLESETREMLRVYDILCTEDTYSALPILVVGYEDDCKRFCSRIPMQNMKTFVRPINREAFLKALRNIADLAANAVQTSTQAEPAASAAESDDFNLDDKNLMKTESALIRKIERYTRLHGRKSVLVVDDDVRMLNVIKLFLQDLYDVTVVPSGKLALKYISKKPTDLILLDYLMPELDGPEVLRQIRNGSDCPNVPVVFLTGVSDKDSVLRGLELKPNGYLLKPVAREALLEKVTEIVLGLT